MVVIGTHRVQNYLAMNDGIMECSIPDSHFELVPPKQVERLEENQEFLILGNGYPALRYLLVMRSRDGNSALFRGPVSVQDNIFAKKMPVVTIVIQLTAQLETRAEWDQPMLRFKAYKFITGECVKHDGWLLPISDRIYPRQIADLVQHHVEGAMGPGTQWKFVGRLANVLGPHTPLWEPRTTVVKPAVRLNGKMSPAAVRMANTIAVDI